MCVFVGKCTLVLMHVHKSENNLDTVFHRYQPLFIFGDMVSHGLELMFTPPVKNKTAATSLSHLKQALILARTDSGQVHSWVLGQWQQVTFWRSLKRPSHKATVFASGTIRGKHVS